MNWELNIRKATAHPIVMELVSPFQTSFDVQHLRGGVIVRVETENGAIGWGEVTADLRPNYAYETTQTALHILNEFLLPNLPTIMTPDSFFDSWLKSVRGHPMAKHGLLSAIFSAVAAEQKIPLVDFVKQLAGESSRKEAVEVGVSIGIQPSIDATLAAIQDYLDDGYNRVKLKIKPGWDVDMVREVRKTYPDLVLMVDANSAYTIDDSPLLQQLDQFNLLMIEQPFGYQDIYQHSLLELGTPICLDESLHTLSDVQAAYKLGACDIVNLKPQRVGGLLESVAIYNFCKEVGLTMWVGGMLETGIGRSVSMALAALPQITLPSDLSETKRYYRPDLADPPYSLIAGTSTIPVSSEIGLGVTVDRGRLLEASTRYANITMPSESNS